MFWSYLGKAKFFWYFHPNVNGSESCEAGLAIFLCKRPDNKYFRLCDTHTRSLPCSLGVLLLLIFLKKQPFKNVKTILSSEVIQKNRQPAGCGPQAACGHPLGEECFLYQKPSHMLGNKKEGPSLTPHKAYGPDTERHAHEYASSGKQGPKPFRMFMGIRWLNTGKKKKV